MLDICGALGSSSASLIKEEKQMWLGPFISFEGSLLTLVMLLELQLGSPHGKASTGRVSFEVYIVFAQCVV